ncbi:MAG: right-handed parallel beta-helix repeat-containing protein, partial [Nanoarchaeota archaeon]|nr:right-handed parallel beta-helix repeat-containing protein [Nanoarchaeota archaeon]
IYAYGIHYSYSSNNSIVNNNVLTEGYESPALIPEAGEDNIIFGGNYTTTNSSPASTALYVTAYANFSMYNVVLNGVNQNDTNLYQTNGSIINMTNCTFNDSKLWFRPYTINKINVFHYLDGQVNDSEGNMITGAYVLGYDKDNTLRFSTDTISGGIIPRQNVLEYQKTLAGNAYYTNYTINASYYALSNASQIYNITQNLNITLTLDNNAPTIASVMLNATSVSNYTTDNLTANPAGATDPDGGSTKLNYNWYRNGVSETSLNMPFTAPDSSNQTYDFSGFSRHGTLFNGTMWNATGGYDGFGAYEFDGVDDWIDTNKNIQEFMNSTTKTISMWIKPVDSSQQYNYAYDGPAAIMDAGGHVGILKGNISGEDKIWVYNWDGDADIVSMDYNIGEWMYVTLVHKDGILYGYKNGELAGSTESGATQWLDHHLEIGVNSWNATNGSIYYWNGSIDEIRIYNHALSTNEVALLYSNRTNVTHSDATTAGENWTVKATPIDEYGLNGTGVISDLILIENTAPTLSSVLINATTASNLINDNLTAYVSGISDIDEDAVEVNYNWYKNGVSDIILNMPFTAPDRFNQTYDFSGYDNHGDMINTTWNMTGGYYGSGAYEFDGNTSRIILNSNDSMYNAIDNYITVHGKIKVYSVGGETNGYHIITKGATTDGGWRISVNTNGLLYAVFKSVSNNAVVRSSQSTINPGQWYDFAVKMKANTTDINSNDIQIYINGTLDQNDIQYYITPTASPAKLKIGCRGEDGAISASFLNGTVDDIQIYNRSLSVNEILLLSYNITNITHSDATSAGDNWTVKATPIDSYGLNGTAVWSNSINITEMLIAFVNQTNPAGEIINETDPILANQNLTIRFNITNIGGSISSVWIKIWETTKAAGTVLWEGLMNLIGGIWQAEVPVNESYLDGMRNYTVFFNDTANKTYEVEGNFSVSGIALRSCGTLDRANTVYYLTQDVTSSGTCFTITSDNVTLEGRGNTINYGGTNSNSYGIRIDANDNATIRNVTINEEYTSGSNKHAIYLTGSKNNLIDNVTVQTKGASNSHGIYLSTNSYNNTIIDSTVSSSGGTGHGIYIASGSIENRIINNTISTTGSGTVYALYLYSNSNTINGNKITNSIGTAVYITGSTGNNLTNNEANSTNGNSYIVFGSTSAQFNHIIGPDNLAEGKPVNYTYNENNKVYDSLNLTKYGQVIFAYCNNITLSNSNLTDDGLSMLYTRNSEIKNNIINATKGFGIYLFGTSQSNNISNNTIMTNRDACDCIYVYSISHLNRISGNMLTAEGSSASGVYSYNSDPIFVDNNTITTKAHGMEMHLSDSSTISNNLITTNASNSYGVFFQSMDLLNMTNNKI